MLTYGAHAYKKEYTFMHIHAAYMHMYMHTQPTIRRAKGPNLCTCVVIPAHIHTYIHTYTHTHTNIHS
jgi:hypothetical protein